MLMDLDIGGAMKKYLSRFRSNVSWCGIDVCIDAWGSECEGRAEKARAVCLF